MYGYLDISKLPAAWQGRNQGKRNLCISEASQGRTTTTGMEPEMSAFVR